MSILEIFVLALVQGVTEFLPVSSSAHLILAGHLLGEDQGLLLDVAIHLGSLAAVIVYFRRELGALATGSASAAFPSVPSRTLARWLVLATVPLVIAGALFAGLVATDLRDVRVIAWASIGFGLVLGVADVRARRRARPARLSRNRALAIGCAQVLALIPGTSRSGITITAGLAGGMSRADASRFAFLLAIPALGAAGAYAIAQMLESGGGIEWGVFTTAIGASALGAWLCIGTFLRLVERIGMLPFVVYRIALGALLLALG